ncbi:MAG: hypothetical protein JWO73_646 [Candidatus Taylorbacteria bacterium]|nr:hypothetical protein [Candidatus Taylorbacteria bacterium]
MAKTCDYTSVGMIVRKGGKILLIERANFPKGFAAPAGHVDGDATYEDAARRELEEEVGLKTDELKLVAEGKRNNPCKREGGSWHHWKVYQVEAAGDVHRSLEETKQVNWYTIEQINAFAQKTEKYVRGEIAEDAWNAAPGLEPIWYDWFKELQII